jgi:uncharacterized membrane protein (UPF0127 family)
MNWKHAAAVGALGTSCVLVACGKASGGPHSESNGVSRASPEIAPSGMPIEHVVVGKTEFKLEVAYKDDTRFKGLSERTEIDEDGGMLFVFPRKGRLYFVMRDCPVDIDIIFLDDRGRITAMHEMKAEPPRLPTEPKPANETDPDPYENRLKRYSSRYEAQYALEFKGGTLAKMDPPLEVGKVVRLDFRRLTDMAEGEE